VKVWIYKGDITNKELAREQASQRSQRPDRGGARRPGASAPAAEAAPAAAPAEAVAAPATSEGAE